MRGGGTYEDADRDTCGNGRNRTGAHVASDTAACGESTENEADVIERLRCCVSNDAQTHIACKAVGALTIVIANLCA